MTLIWYVIDTSSLIELNKHNPMDLYPGVWMRLEHLVDQNRLYSPKEVHFEISQIDDTLLEWSDENAKMFVEPTEGQIAIVKEILAEFPSLIKIDRRYDADPWVISLAMDMIRNPQRTLVDVRKIVVTEEKIRGNRVRIPFICEFFGIETINILDLLRMEGWTF